MGLKEFLVLPAFLASAWCGWLAIREVLREWRSSRAGPRTTERATTDSQWDAAVQASIGQGTSGSQPWAPPITTFGGAVFASRCVGAWHCFWMAEDPALPLPREVGPTCRCGALRLSGQIAVPVVTPTPVTTSTYPRPGSPLSAASTSAPSPSSESISSQPRQAEDAG